LYGAKVKFLWESGAQMLMDEADEADVEMIKKERRC